jgi:pimeloyl-ACP methyl ester carboxylesterase
MRDRIKANGIMFNVCVEGRDGAPWLTFSNSHATDLSLWGHAHYIVIEDAAHITNVEKPRAFNAALERFLDDVS